MTLAPNGSCKIGVKMTPGGTGMRSASLNVRGTPGGNASATLRGTGLAPGQISLVPQGAFNVVDVGAPIAVPFTVTNTGGAATTAISLTPAGATEFTITNDQCTGMTLDPNASCMFKVLFTPTTYGARSGMVTASATTGGTSVAAFQATGRDYVLLTVTKQGMGNGTISASGLTCTNTMCTGQYPRTDPAAFQVVNISATPDAVSIFGGWGVACNGTAGCQVTMSMPQSVTAAFTVKQILLTATIRSVSGQTGSVSTGDGSFTCPMGTCGPGKHNAQPMITFIATPNMGYTFAAWSDGPCKGVNPTCTIPATGDITVTATFGPPNYMFVTSSTVVPGRLNGIAGADAECSARATAAGLPGVYKAWINDKGVDSINRIGPGGWVRTDGRPFTRGLGALMASNQTVYYPPRVDENGNDFGTKRTPVITGGNNYGLNFGYQCNGTTTASWTQTTGGAYIGIANAGSQYWSFNELDGAGCSDQLHLYCFRTDLPAVAITFPPENAKHIFVSDTSFIPTPMTGLQAADIQCQKDATTHALPNPGTYVAFLATSTTPAIKRVKIDGPTWKRPDEVLVAATPTDLAMGNLMAPINVQGDGTYKNPQMWTGAADPMSVGTNTCKDWTNASGMTMGQFGYPNATIVPDWFNSGNLTCDNLYSWIICIEP
jgi:hypothetical protein